MFASDPGARPVSERNGMYSPVGGMLNAGGRSFSGSAQVTVSARRHLTPAQGRNAATAGFQEPRAMAA